MADKPKEFKRANRAVPVGEALAGTLDPVLKKRGFASRDLITHWHVIAPSPFNQVSAPDKLVWPRGEKRAEGAVLHLRCQASHKLTLAHEGHSIAAAINSYFGFFLVGDVRITAASFEPVRAALMTNAKPSAAVQASIASVVEQVEDDGLKEALRRLGLAVSGRERPR